MDAPTAPTAPTTPTNPVAPIVVGKVAIAGAPAGGALLVSGTVVLTATPISTTGSPVSGKTISWGSSDPTIATVTAGTVTGVASGPVMITATVDGVVGSTALSVRVPIPTPLAGAATPTVAAVLGGGVTLTIPATAVPAGIALTVAPAALPSDNRVVPATTYVFGPDGTTFTVPITLGLRYDKAAITAADQANLWVASVDANGVATPLAGSTVDLTKGVVSAPVAHFSTYTIVKPAAPASINTFAGNAQSAVVGTAITAPISVRVLDAAARPVPGAAVRFAVATGSGTLSGTTTATANNLGVATLAGAWSLGTSAGAQTLSASLTTGSVTAATIAATATPGAATKLVLTTSATGAASGAAFTTQPVVAVKDANSNTVTSASHVVTMTVSAGASVVGTNTATAVNGVATFSTVGISGTAGTSYTLTFAATGLTSVAQTITLAATVAVASVDVSPASASLTVGQTQQLSATPKDASGNALAGRTVTWTTSAASVATVSGTGLVTAVAVGTATITATSEGKSGTAALTVTVASATQVVLTTSAAGAASGVAFTTQPVVTIRDASGNTVTGASSVVTMTASAGATIVGTATATAVNGVATFSTVGIIGTAGTTYTLTFAASGLTSAAQTITLAAFGAATKLELTTAPTGWVTGAAFTTQPVVTVKDANGITVTSASHVVTMTVSAGATTVGTATATAVNGVATFSTVGISGPAGIVYTCTFSATGLISEYHSTTLAAFGAATVLELTIAASGGVIGEPFPQPPVLVVKDASGHRVTSASHVVTMTVSAGATIVGTNTATAVNGLVTFSSVGLSGTAGTVYTLTFAATGLTSATQTITLALAAAGATQLVLTRQAASETGFVSGQSFATQPVVTLKDANGNTVLSGKVVTMTVSAGASVVGTSTATAVNGVAKFCDYPDYNCVGISGTVGTTHTLTFSAPGLTSATQTITLSLRAGTPTQLVLTRPAAGAASATAFTTQPVVTVQDAAGNTQNVGSAKTVIMTVSAGASVRGTATATAVNGVATFSTAGIIGTAGTTYTLTFVASGVTSATQSIRILCVGGCAATQLALSTTANGAVSGAAFTTQPVVAVKDAEGTTVTSASHVVTMTVTAVNNVGGSAGVSVVGTNTATAVNGVATFSSVGLSGTAGTLYTLTFAATGLTPAIQGIPLAAFGAATKLELTTASAGAVNGAAFTTQPVVTVKDANGTTVTNATSVVTMTVSGGASLFATNTATAVNGVATFRDLGISGTAGTTYTLTFAAIGLTSATQTITATAGRATQLTLLTKAAGAASGAAFTTQPLVVVQDAGGTTVPSPGSVVTMTVSAGATIVGTNTATVVDGVARFSTVGLSANAGTTHTLTFAAPGLISAYQTSIAVGPGAATQLELTIAAAGAVSGMALTTLPVVTVKDAHGNAVPNAREVTMTVSAGASIIGGASSTTVYGVARFPGVGLSGTAGVYTLTFAATGLPSVTQTITLAVPAAATKLVLSTPAAGATSGAAFTTQPLVVVQDVNGNRVPTEKVVTMTVSAGASIVGEASTTPSYGVAHFDGGLGIRGTAGTAGTVYTLTFAATGLTSATQTITLRPGAATQLVLQYPAAGAVSGAVFTQRPSVYVRDADGNPVPYGKVVTMTVSAGASIFGKFTATSDAVYGVATFPGVGISGNVGTYTLTFAAGCCTSVTQSITISSLASLGYNYIGQLGGGTSLSYTTLVATIKP